MPMIEIGGKPILWHIMKIYSAHGVNEFVVCLGYKGYVIKEYFANYFLHMSDVTFDLRERRMEVHQNKPSRGGSRSSTPARTPMTGGRLSACCRLRRRRGRSASPTATASPTSTSRAGRVPPASRPRSPPSPRCSRPGASARSRSTASA